MFAVVSRLLTAVLLCTLQAAAATPVFNYQIVAKYPHSTHSYTEGFFFLNGNFYEGTGLQGHSEILVTDPATGQVQQHVAILPPYFGEGIVNWGPNLLEWTWQTHTGFVIDRFSLRTLHEFHYTGEGWGMTRTDKQIITSDGTATLRFRNPETFAEQRHLLVTDEGKPIDQLNELEYIKGVIYANVWHSDRIARISPKDGKVLSWIDCTGILPADQRVDMESVLNGIAYDAQHDRLFITGKQWPTIFEIKVVPKPR